MKKVKPKKGLKEDQSELLNGHAENHIAENSVNILNDLSSEWNSKKEDAFKKQNGCGNLLPNVNCAENISPLPISGAKLTSLEKLIKKLEDCQFLAAEDVSTRVAKKLENCQTQNCDVLNCNSETVIGVNISNDASERAVFDKGTPSIVAKNIVNAAVNFVENFVNYSPESREICIDSKIKEQELNKSRIDNVFRTLSDDTNAQYENFVELIQYKDETQMSDIMRLITKDLSEPYSIYTYRYFIHNWPHLCYLAKVNGVCVGAIVCKLSLHARGTRRGYIAMLAVDEQYRRQKIGTKLVTQAIEAMIQQGCDEVVLETEVTNKSALKLYENLGFVRDKRLFRYYLNGVDAFRLKLWLKPPQVVQYL